MTSPYTAQPGDAFLAAQSSVGLLLGALVWFRAWRPRVATLLVLLAIAIAVWASPCIELLAGLGIRPRPKELLHALKLSAAVATLATLLTRRWGLVAVAVAGEAALWKITDYLTESDAELAASYVAFFGLLVGIHLGRTLRLEALAASAPARPPPASPPASLPPPAPLTVPPLRSRWRDDVAAFLVGTAAGALVCRVVLHGWTNSADEWANTYQAAVFAKLRAYASVPRCADAFHSFWVFQYMGRSFAQYTPGWPLFMVPFVVVRAAWLAGPASLGVLAAGIARLGRRLAKGVPAGTAAAPEALVRAAGWCSVGVLLLGAELLINGGSRYPHVFVAAMLAWSVEALLTIAGPSLSRSGQWGWGAVLGGAAAMMLAARPGDGATLGLGLFLYFVYALVRGRVGWRAAVATGVVFGLVVGGSLVILRLQLGRWFQTGYSLTTTVYPWVDFKWSLPGPSEFKWGLPIATSAYCWFPCAPALALAGLAALQGRARPAAFVFAVSFLAFFAFYACLTLGRGFDLGYGPRYVLPSVVPMAVGAGVPLARLWTAARARWSAAPALHRSGPAAVALVAVLLGAARLAPLLYPFTYADVQSHNRLHEALAPLHLRNAVVFGGAGLNNTDPADLTENLPPDLYPNEDVLVLLEHGPEAVRCVRELYPKRHFYRAIPGPRVQIAPL